MRRKIVIPTMVVLFVACGSGGPVTLVDITTMRCPNVSAPASTAGSLPALSKLAELEHNALHGTLVLSGHGRVGPEPPIQVPGSTAQTLRRELRAAARVACQLRTTDDAQRAGYIRSANYDQGIGTHWTNWQLVTAPFDPTRPAMLLYAPHLGETQLVGFSYWVRTPNPTGPDGFAGPADHWHRHYGLCFDHTGILQTEDLRSPTLCNGIYLNGQDLWMLHAWIVPSEPNVWGTFAALNPQLCSHTGPDLARCSGFA